MTVERELVEMAQRGDEDAFGAVVRLSADRLYALAYRILRDPDGADDATQEALVQAWRDLGMLRDPERFDSWLNRLLVRSCYRVARRERTRTDRVRQIRPAARTDDDELVTIVRRDELDEPFRRLSAEHRAVVVLRFYLGLSIPEISETLAIPAGTAASRLHYALRELRAALDAGDRNVISLRRQA